MDHILIRKIENEISLLENNLNVVCDMNKKRALDAQLDNLCNSKAKGVQVRSRYKWITEGEKNTKYFLGLENKQQSTNIIRKLKSIENVECAKRHYG